MELSFAFARRAYAPFIDSHSSVNRNFDSLRCMFKLTTLERRDLLPGNRKFQDSVLAGCARWLASGCAEDESQDGLRWTGYIRSPSRTESISGRCCEEACGNPDLTCGC